MDKPESQTDGGHRISSFVPGPRLQFSDCVLGQGRVAGKVMGIEDGTNVAETMPGDGGNFGLAASCHRQSCYRRTSQVVEGESPGNASLVSGLEER